MSLRKKKRPSLLRKTALSLVGMALVAGCGSSNNFAQTQVSSNSNLGTVTIRDDGQPISSTGDVADTLELEVFNQQGEVIYGPVRTPLSSVNVFENVPRPPEAAYLEIDYLRNAGFLLFRAEVDANGQVEFTDPNEQPVDPQDTDWEVVPNGSGGFTLTSAVTGEPLRSTFRAQQTEVPVKLKGVCYSPAPINFSNKEAPAVGDLFWDTYAVIVDGEKVDDVFNWFALWGEGSLSGTPYYGRNDLNRIRDLGCNSIRVYSMLARQLGEEGEIPPPESGHLFEHKMFLDRCWNNGHNPLYVIVDIPMADACVRADVNPEPGEIEFWESNLEETVLQLKDHPAVIGFNIWNEKDAEPASFPANGEPSELTEYFYGQSAKYAGFIQENAPGKLAGWAYHDAPAFVKFASVKPEGNPYMAQMKEAGFDYWGVNSYQTLSYSSILGNEPGSYGNIPEESTLPVLFTELGWPATGHRDPGDPNSIYEDEETRAKTAEVISRMYPQALGSDLVMGTFYFEFQDEWWKQELEGNPNYNAYTWNGTPAAPTGFPNGYWDEEGFGLFSTARAGDRENQEKNRIGNGAVLPVDDIIERTELTEALTEVYESH